MSGVDRRMGMEIVKGKGQFWGEFGASHCEGWWCALPKWLWEEFVSIYGEETSNMQINKFVKRFNLQPLTTLTTCLVHEHPTTMMGYGWDQMGNKGGCAHIPITYTTVLINVTYTRVHVFRTRKLSVSLVFIVQSGPSWWNKHNVMYFCYRSRRGLLGLDDPLCPPITVHIKLHTYYFTV